jgi:hypothetical protein
MKNSTSYLFVLVLSVSLLSLSLPARAQYSFANPTTLNIGMAAIAADGQGNSIVTGHVSNGPIALGTFSLANGNYVAKMDAANIWQWTKKIQSSGWGGATINDVAVDNAGNIYIAGWFEGTVLFDNISLTSTSGTTSTSYADLFVAKMGPSGSFIWAKKEGTKNGSDQAKAVSTDGSGNVYVTGYATRKTFTNVPWYSTGELTDIYILKYSATGTKLWEKKIANSANNSSGISSLGQDLMGNDIIADPSGNIFVTGRYYGTVSFGNGSGLSISSADRSSFTAKLNSSGATQWVKSAISNGADNGTSIFLDNSNNVYIGGTYEGTGSLSFGTLSLSGAHSFLAKYSTSGSLSWATNLQGNNNSSPFADPYGVKVIGATTLSVRVAIKDYGIQEVSQANASVLSSEPAVGYGSSGYVGINDIASNSSGFIFCGDILGSLTFGNITIYSACDPIADPGCLSSEAFLVRYTTPFQRSMQSTPGETSANAGIKTYPNPIKDILYIRSNNENVLGRIYLFDQSGRKVLENNIPDNKTELDLKALPPGNYYLQSEQQIEAVKLIKQ